MTDAPKILSLDEDRKHQAGVAEAFNQAGLFLRFVADRRKLLPGLHQLEPQLLLLHAEVRSELTEQVLASLEADVRFAPLPIALLCEEDGDQAFVAGLRTGVVALLRKPFDPKVHVPEVRALMRDLPSRPGSATGQGQSAQFTALVEHLRRTRRTGLLTLNARTPSEGRAAFVRGRLESASYAGKRDVEALISMVTQARATWSFTEMGGASGEGTVVIDLAADEAVGEPLPESAPAEDALELPIEPGPKPGAPQPIARPQVLLVDDDPALCKMFSTLLRKHGFEVTTAADGVEGYQAALRGRFEVVVADLNMPRMDGWGLLRMLREDFHTRELPLAFLSCHDDYRESLKALEVGAQAYLSKSTRLDALVTRLWELLEPIAALRRLLSANQVLPLRTSVIGPQRLIRELGAGGISGRLDLADGWARYQVVLENGHPVHATAHAGRHTAEGERAFNAFIASQGAEGALEPGMFPAPTTLRGRADELVTQACATLNENERRIREGQLLSASEIEVNPALYEVYTRVGPRPWLETARLICEDRLPPREVIARSSASPIEVEDTLKDLIRRGVVTLRGGSAR